MSLRAGTEVDRAAGLHYATISLTIKAGEDIIIQDVAP